MIRGYFNPTSGWPAPWVRVFLYLPGIVEEWKPAEFLLDTGCSVTGLQPLDAIFRVGVPLDRIMDPNQ